MEVDLDEIADWQIKLIKENPEFDPFLPANKIPTRRRNKRWKQNKYKTI